MLIGICPGRGMQRKSSSVLKMDGVGAEAAATLEKLRLVVVAHQRLECTVEDLAQSAAEARASAAVTQAAVEGVREGIEAALRALEDMRADSGGRTRRRAGTVGGDPAEAGWAGWWQSVRSLQHKEPRPVVASLLTPRRRPSDDAAVPAPAGLPRVGNAILVADKGRRSPIRGLAARVRRLSRANAGSAMHEPAGSGGTGTRGMDGSGPAHCAQLRAMQSFPAGARSPLSAGAMTRDAEPSSRPADKLEAHSENPPTTTTSSQIMMLTRKENVLEAQAHTIETEPGWFIRVLPALTDFRLHSFASCRSSCLSVQIHSRTLLLF